MNVESDDDDDVPTLVLAPSDRETKIPVTILTGFLGAGKTTLLRHLLTASHGKRIAVIENEFSSGLGIEGMIAMNGVDGSDMSTFFELNNGCICCSVKDNLLATLEQLVLHKDRFDYIVIETTGVANPGPVISVFWADEGLESSIKLDGVVCVVDCKNIQGYLANEDTRTDVMQQICYADRILLNKSDLVDSTTLGSIEVAVRGINSIAEVRTTNYSTVSTDWVLDIDSYYSRQLLDASFMCVPCGSETSNPILQSNKGFFGGSHIANTLATEHILIPGVFDKVRLSRVLDDILYGQKAEQSTHGSAGTATLVARSSTVASASDMQGAVVSESSFVSVPSIYRMKGVVHTVDSPHLHILQAVHDIFELYPSSHVEGSTEDRSNGYNLFIVIGRGLNKDSLTSRLSEALHSK